MSEANVTLSWMENWSQQLNSNLDRIVTHLDVSTGLILDELLSKGVLTSHEVDSIRVERTRHDKSRLFVSKLKQKSEAQVEIVIKTIRVTQGPMADYLQQLFDVARNP